MRNPWTKKNPLMSMWLSAANRTVGTARGQATAAAKRQVAKAQKDAFSDLFSMAQGKSTSAASRKRTRK